MLYFLAAGLWFPRYLIYWLLWKGQCHLYIYLLCWLFSLSLHCIVQSIPLQGVHKSAITCLIAQFANTSHHHKAIGVKQFVVYICMLSVSIFLPLLQGCCFEFSGNPQCFYGPASYQDLYIFGHGHGSLIEVVEFDKWFLF